MAVMSSLSHIFTDVDTVGMIEEVRGTAIFKHINIFRGPNVQGMMEYFFESERQVAESLSVCQ